MKHEGINTELFEICNCHVSQCDKTLCGFRLVGRIAQYWATRISSCIDFVVNIVELLGNALAPKIDCARK
jgi:hypothetical protein